MFMMKMMMLVNNIITIPSVDIFMTMMVAIIIIIIVSIIRTAVKASTVTIRMVILIMIAALVPSTGLQTCMSLFLVLP